MAFRFQTRQTAGPKEAARMGGEGGAGPATFPEPAPLLPLTPLASLRRERTRVLARGLDAAAQDSSAAPELSSSAVLLSVAVSLRSSAHPRASPFPHPRPLPRLLPEPTPNPRATPQPHRAAHGCHGNRRPVSHPNPTWTAAKTVGRPAPPR